MDIVSRLKRFIDTHQIPVTQFADNCRIPRPTLSQLLNGRNKKVSDEVISKIHEAYPRLSVLWLMFGEGGMEMPANIEMSAPENPAIEPAERLQPADGINLTPQFDFENEFREETPEKSHTASTPPFPHFERQQRPATDTSSATITFGEKGRRVISIVVYYDDNSYESFVPDPSGRSPFAR